MKKLIYLSLLIISSFTAFAQEQAAKQEFFTFPTKDEKVIYEQVVDVSGKDMLGIYTRVTSWYFSQFKNVDSKIVSSDPSIGQMIANVKADINDVFYTNFTIQIDCKDNKYRCRITNIRHTVKGKENTPFFAKYLVNVSAESDNEVFVAQKKGYSKSQKSQIQTRMLTMNDMFNGYLASLNAAVNKKAEEF